MGLLSFSQHTPLWIFYPLIHPLTKQYKGSHLLPGSVRCLSIKVPALPARVVGNHVRRQHFGVCHTSRSAQQACQLLGQAGASVAGSLLGSDADLHDGEKKKTCQ